MKEFWSYSITVLRLTARILHSEYGVERYLERSLLWRERSGLPYLQVSWAHEWREESQPVLFGLHMLDSRSPHKFTMSINRETLRITNILKTDINYVLVLVTQSCPTLATPWTVAHQAQSLGFSRQECWRRVPCPFPGEFSRPRDWTWVSHIAGSFFTSGATREGQLCIRLIPNSRKQKKTDFHSTFVLRSSCFWIPLQSLWCGKKQANWISISVTWLKFPHFNVSFFF